MDWAIKSRVVDLASVKTEDSVSTARNVVDLAPVKTEDSVATARNAGEYKTALSFRIKIWCKNFGGPGVVVQRIALE